MSGIKAEVDGWISGKKVMMFSKTYCPYCKKAKAVFQKYMKDLTLSKDDYEVVEIDEMNECDEIQDYLKELTKARSVPRVFINGECIGGWDETRRLDSKDKLKDLLS
ncbi:Glutaredoxin-2 [Mactra antiquata]